MRLTVEADAAGERLDRYLAQSLPGVSRATVMKYLKEGAARLNGRRARPGLLVRAGDVLDLPGLEERIREIRRGAAEGVPEVPRLGRTMPGVLVLYEDEHMVAVSKPPGLVMHPGKGHAEEGLDRLLAERFGAATRLVHRIDRDTSGVVVAARGHPKSARRLAEAFRTGEVEKRYFALVEGAPDPASGSIRAPLLDTKEVGSRVTVGHAGKESRTDFETAQAFAGWSWLLVRPWSGRRHQIRVHLAHAGHPLAVDPVYGRRRKLRLQELRPDLPKTWKNPVVLKRTPLHAAEIRLRHPITGEDVSFAAPLPQDLGKVLDLLTD